MIPQDLCLDANVLIASMTAREVHHRSALQLMKIIQDRQIVLYEPALLLYEVVATLYRRKISGEITAAEVEEFVDHFYQLPILFQWKPAVIQQASEVAEKLSLKRMYDCTYLAIAQLRNIPLITLDEQLIRRGRKCFPKIQTPAEFLEGVQPICRAGSRHPS